VAQYFTVNYTGTYKYVRDLRKSPPQIYVLYQARSCRAAAAGRAWRRRGAPMARAGARGRAPPRPAARHAASGSRCAHRGR
jgi:hypothetical protein